MSASATTESASTSPAEGVTLADAPTEQFGPEQFGPEQLGAEPTTATTQQPTIGQMHTATIAPLQPQPAPTAPTSDRDSSTQTISIIAFALSVAALISPSFVLLPIASLVLGIIALARKPRAKGFALTAVIISGVMLAFAAILAVGAVMVFGLAAIGSIVG